MGDHLRAADVLASGIHDAKNRLFEIGTMASEDSTVVRRQLLTVAFRLDRTLTAYRLLNHEDIAATVPAFIPHLVEDVLVRCQMPPHVRVGHEVGFQGEWPLSRELVEETLINALQNAGRFARSGIRLRAIERDGLLVFEVNDDGPGFGAEAADRQGIGLYLAERIACMHRRPASGDTARRGRLTLANGGQLGGALFTLELP